MAKNNKQQLKINNEEICEIKFYDEQNLTGFTQIIGYHQLHYWKMCVQIDVQKLREKLDEIKDYSYFSFVYICI